MKNTISTPLAILLLHIILFSGCTNYCQERIFTASELEDFMNQKTVHGTETIEKTWVKEWPTLHLNSVAPYDEILHVANLYNDNISFKTYVNELEDGGCEGSQFIGLFENIIIEDNYISGITVLFQDSEAFDEQFKEIQKIKELRRSFSIFNPSLFFNKYIKSQGFINMDYLYDIEYSHSGKFDGLGSTLYSFSYSGKNYFRSHGTYDEIHGFVLLSKREDIEPLESFADLKNNGETEYHDFAKMALATLKCTDEQCLSKIFNSEDYYLYFLKRHHDKSISAFYRPYKHIHDDVTDKTVDANFNVSIDENNITSITIFNYDKVGFTGLEFQLLELGYERAFGKENPLSGAFVHNSAEMPTVRFEIGDKGVTYEIDSKLQ